MTANYKYDYLIIGAGIMGMTIAYELLKTIHGTSIAILEKESDVGQHASGRNSGVLHAGFYYTPDSLKARFTRDGNRLMKEFCKKHSININECGKVVVAKNRMELESLYELERRGTKNGVELRLISEKELYQIEPNAKTYKKALHSPTTATVNPLEVCLKLKEVLAERGVKFFFDNKYLSNKKNLIHTNHCTIDAGYVINAAGLYADHIAKDFGFAGQYTIIPFKGRYLKYTGKDAPIKTNIYPVPDLKNPFLGVHYTLTSIKEIKIGPTAMPAFWRENYKGFGRFKLNEFLEILYFESHLFLRNSFNFRDLAWNELKKRNRKYFSSLAMNMVWKVNAKKFDQWLPSGIRAQLLNKKTFNLEMDFIVEGDHQSLHILNAVSPAFTCSFALAKYIVGDKLKLQKLGQLNKVSSVAGIN